MARQGACSSFFPFPPTSPPFPFHFTPAAPPSAACSSYLARHCSNRKNSLIRFSPIPSALSSKALDRSSLQNRPHARTSSSRKERVNSSRRKVALSLLRGTNGVSSILPYGAD